MERKSIDGFVREGGVKSKTVNDVRSGLPSRYLVEKERREKLAAKMNQKNMPRPKTSEIKAKKPAVRPEPKVEKKIIENVKKTNTVARKNLKKENIPKKKIEQESKKTGKGKKIVIGVVLTAILLGLAYVATAIFVWDKLPLPGIRG